MRLFKLRTAASMLLAAALLVGCGGGGGSDSTDTSRPTVTYVTPANNEVNVPPNTKVAVTFSEAMNLSSLAAAITLVDTASNANVALQPVEFDTTNNIATISPQQTLLGLATYQLRISTAATDLAGNSILAAYVSSFVTAAAVGSGAPIVASFAPGDGEVGVGTNSAVAFAFSEPMNAASLEPAFSLSDGVSAPIQGTVLYIGQVGVFKPASPLLASTRYVVTLTSAAISNTGNALSPKSWTFTTGAGPDLTAPKVMSVVPKENSLNVPPNTAISATFDSAIYPFTFGQIDGFATPVLIDYSTNTVTLSPTVPLAPNTPFTNKIEATDLAGNPTSYSWNFETGN